MEDKQKKRYILEGRLYEAADVDQRTDKNYVQRVRDWVVPVTDDGIAQRGRWMIRRACELKAELAEVELTLSGLNIENYEYITGIGGHRK